MDPEEPTVYEYDVLCRTIGCENENIIIRIQTDAEPPTVICGPCGAEITDIIPVPSE